jgi:hypothetical protein
MVKAYPQFRSSYSHEEMVGAFSPDSDRVATGVHVPRRREPLSHGVALKISHLGYVPDPRYQGMFAHSLPVNSACCGIPLYFYRQRDCNEWAFRQRALTLGA